MIHPAQLIVAVNGGSSSLKVAIYGDAIDAPPLHKGRQDGCEAAWLIRWIEDAGGNDPDCLVGHRVVASRSSPAVEDVTPALLTKLHLATADDPIHLPSQLALIEAIATAMPRARQFACSDSAFHATIPPAGRHLPIPRAFDDMGLVRHGFHGLSCASVVNRLRRTHGEKAASGRLIVAHLGGGSSVTAIHNGRSMDTSMGFSPDGGVMMATRPGDLDPGVIFAMQRRLRASSERLSDVLAFESGLRGRAGDSGDMRLLVEREARDPQAAEAIAMFCRSIARAIAGAATTIGGIDTLVFTGGVGEHMPAIRTRICNALQFLSPMTVHVIATEEELMIAELVRQHVAIPG